MAGFVDRDGAMLQDMRVWLRAQMHLIPDGSSEQVMINRVLVVLDELVAFKRDYEPALIRNAEIIQDLRRQVEKLERTAHELRQRGEHVQG